MKISERLLRQYLDHVYWICGGPCGGKSTMTKQIATRWGMRPYSSDDHVFDYQRKANPQDHPAILRHFVDWEWYFLGRGNDRGQWLRSVFEETVEFVILDLLQMGRQTPIVVDAFMEPGFLRAIADPNRIVYLFAEEELIRAQYLERDHLRGMKRLFGTVSDPERAKRETLDIAVRASQHYYQQVEQEGVPYFIRTPDTTVEEMLGRIERHFGLI